MEDRCRYNRLHNDLEAHALAYGSLLNDLFGKSKEPFWQPRIHEGERLFETEKYVLVSETDYVSRRDLAQFPFEKDIPTNEMKAPVSADLLRHFDANREVGRSCCQFARSGLAHHRHTPPRR